MNMTMKESIALIIAAVTLTGLTACSAQNLPESELSQSEGSTEISLENSGANSQKENTSDTEYLQSGSSSDEFDYEYLMAHRYDNVVKTRGIYGETEIPDIHYEKADPEGRVTHSPFGEDWQYFGLESMELERLEFGDYTLSLIGTNVRTDKEYFPDRIFVTGLQIEVEKNGEPITINGGYTKDITSDWGAQYYHEDIIFADKIGSYLAAYELKYPVIAARYYYPGGDGWKVGSSVEFNLIKDGSLEGGFGIISEPGCGANFNSEPSSYKDMLIPNSEVTVCRAAIFEADEFKIVDDHTLLDETAGITYTFDFNEHQVKHTLPFELITAEKNVGSVVWTDQKIYPYFG